MPKRIELCARSSPVPKRLQYIRWLQRRRGARRSAGNCDVVDAHQQRFAFDVGKADVQVAGQTVLHRAVDVNLVELAHDAVVQTSRAGPPDAQDSFGISSLRDGASLAEADDAGNIQRAGTHAALVAAAVDDGARSARADSCGERRARPRPSVRRSCAAEIDSRSMFCLITSTGILPTAWTASVWKITPRSRDRACRFPRPAAPRRFRCWRT